MPTDIDIIYSAGFFDGEGSIYMMVVNKGDGKVHRLEVAVASTSIEELTVLGQIWGKVAMPITSTATRLPNAKPQVNLKWTNGSARVVLQTLQPYLRIKRRQCDLALRYLDLLNNRGRTSRISEEEWDERESIRLELSRLNHRGIQPFTKEAMPYPWGPELTCHRCGKTFFSTRKDVRFCSSVCASREHKANRTKHERTCPTCNNTFLGDADQVYCSRQCRGRNPEWQATVQAARARAKAAKQTI